jgi:catechol 2,3-dioxygenase-like lactoylglutathione lyase family enzyme
MKSIAIVFAIVGMLPLAAAAQVPPFNEAGVTMGHNHVTVPDPEVHKKIWVDVLGAQASGNPGLDFLKLPGTFVLLSKGTPTGGSEGTSLDHFAFAVKDYDGTRDRLKAAGVTIARDRSESPREFVAIFPDGVKVEFYEDKLLAGTIQHHHLHFRTTDPDGLRAWWVKAFGAQVRQEGTRTITTIPGAMLSFTKVDTPAPPTRGRSLDHTGVNVKNVNEYCAKLAGMGIVCERPRGTDTPIAMVTDPAGTRIEINQGLESR